jgi:hypothetical protein
MWPENSVLHCMILHVGKKQVVVRDLKLYFMAIFFLL